MKTTKIIFGLFIVQVSFLIAAQTIFCQPETVDIVTYTPPKGWTKTPKDGVTVYNITDKATGGYCLLTVYPSTAATGSPQKDFAGAWAERVATPFKAEADPKTQTTTDDGWTSVTAATQIESDGMRSALMFTVISGYGRSASILAIVNNQEYFPQIDAFMAGIKMDKAQAKLDAQPPPPAQTAPTSPGTPVANSYDPAALLGSWGNGIASDSVSGSFITYGSSATQQYYKFNADGTYSFVYSGYSGLVGQSGSFHMTTNETGVYTINGDSITITAKKSQTNSNGGGLHNNPLETVTYKWTIHYFEGSKYYSLVLHPDKQTKRDGTFSFGCTAFPNSYCYAQMK